MVTSYQETLGYEWTVAYCLAMEQSEKQAMLYLLGLEDWPPLSRMYGDLVDDLALICNLLSKKPMVGYLVAKRLNLDAQKTRTLLSVLEAKGYVKAVGEHLKHAPFVFNQAEQGRQDSRKEHRKEMPPAFPAIFASSFAT